MQLRKNLASLLTAFVLAGCGSDQDFVFTAPQSEPTTKLMAVYLIGSDLESRDAAGTTDLDEMVDGLNQMTPAERSQLDLVIAFGGAKKPGWQGVKVMNAEQLLEDAEDGIYGNASGPDAYLFTDANFNMSDPANLQLFLTYLATEHSFQRERFLVLWNHGSGYEGYGFDETFGQLLSISEVENALVQSGLPKLDLLGFDACLMANLEVASALRNEARYLLASEELEPGHGWNYRYVVPNFVRKPTYDYAVGVVDDFVKHSSHPYKSNGKTLSVLDLDQLPGLIAYLDLYAGALAAEVRPNSQAAPQFVRSMVEVQRFMEVPGLEFGAALDLKDFVQRSLLVEGEAKANLLAALKHVVVYAKEDGTRPLAGGLSIITPDQNAQRLPFTAYPSQGWASLARASLEIIGSDLQAPVLTGLERTAQFLRATFNDSLLVKVTAVNGFVENNLLVVLEQAPARLTDSISRWEIPVWDGAAYHIEYDSVLPATPLATTFIRTGEIDGQSFDLYRSRIEYLDADDAGGVFKRGHLEFVVVEGEVEDYYIKTYQFDDDGQLVQDKIVEEFGDGDQFRTWAIKVSEGEQTGEASEPFGGTFTVTAPPTIERRPVVLPGGSTASFALKAIDFAGHKTVSPFQSL